MDISSTFSFSTPFSDFDKLVEMYNLQNPKDSAIKEKYALDLAFKILTIAMSTFDFGEIKQLRDLIYKTEALTQQFQNSSSSSSSSSSSTTINVKLKPLYLCKEGIDIIYKNLAYFQAATNNGHPTESISKENKELIDLAVSINKCKTALSTLNLSEKQLIVLAPYLTYVDCRNIPNNINLVEVIKNCLNIESLYINSRTIVVLPELPNCITFDCTDCTALESFPHAMPNCRTFKCNGCIRLQTLPKMPKCRVLECLNCIRLVTIPTPANYRHVNCSHCTAIEELPELPNCHTLVCKGCTSIITLPKLNNLDLELDLFTYVKPSDKPESEPQLPKKKLNSNNKLTLVNSSQLQIDEKKQLKLKSKKPKVSVAQPLLPALRTLIDNCKASISQTVSQIKERIRAMNENLTQIDESNPTPKAIKKWKIGNPARSELDKIIDRLTIEIDLFSILKKDSSENESTLLKLQDSEKIIFKHRISLQSWDDRISEAIKNLLEYRACNKQKAPVVKNIEGPKERTFPTRKDKLDAKNRERLEKQKEKIEQGKKVKAIKKQDPLPIQLVVQAELKSNPKTEADFKLRLKSASSQLKPHVSIVSSSGPAALNSRIRYQALETTFKNVMSLGFSLIYFENNHSNVPGLYPCIQHFALQRYLLGCIQALKTYKNTGAHIPPELSKELLEDQRNFLIHADWLSTDQKVLKESMDAVLLTAREYAKKLPLEKFRKQYLIEPALKPKQLNELLNIRSFDREMAVEFLSSFGVIKGVSVHSYTFDTILILDGTPLYELGARYHQAKKDNNIVLLDHVNTIKNYYIPIINTLTNPIFKFIDPQLGGTKDPLKIKENFHFQLAAIEMLLTICGELGAVVKGNEALATFCGRCHAIRNHVGHEFSEVNVLDILYACEEALKMNPIFSDLKQFL